VGEEQCEWLSKNGYFYIMHRFNNDILGFVALANAEEWPLISISVGVKDSDRKIIDQLKSSSLKVDFITVDIAHGYSRLMRDMLKYIKDQLPDVCVIAGNVCTPEAVVALNKWGADYIKVGIGQGSPCTTKDKTGFTVPMFSTVMSCSDCYSSQSSFAEGKRIPIIADGGIQCNGDIAKALVAGADVVMAGSLFASCIDSAGELTPTGNKKYFGSASLYNKKENKNIEGKLQLLEAAPFTIKDKLIEITEDLQSAISYAGGADLKALERRAVDYCII